MQDQFNRPLRDLRLSVIDRCNFRCPYCMPADLFTEDYQFIEKSQRLSVEEMLRLARIFSELGVVKLRITGGEPLLHPGIMDLVAGFSRLDGIQDLALTTNGVLLPTQAERLKHAGLHRLTVSLDTLDTSVFRQLSGNRGQVDHVLGGVQAAKDAGFSPIKINSVIQRGVNEQGLEDLLEWARENGHIVRLIEFMDVGTRNGWQMDKVVPSQVLLDRIQQRWPLMAMAASHTGEVARRYRYLDGQGEIGLISSVTQPFCGGCNRARLTSDGTFYTCLFATTGFDLRPLLRSGANDADISQAISKVWQGRADRYSELRGTQNADNKIEMYRMGG